MPVRQRPPAIQRFYGGGLRAARFRLHCQPRDGAREPDAARPFRRRGEYDRGRRYGEVRPVVLADAEDVQADPIGELDLLEQVAQALGGVTVRPVAGFGSSANV